MHDVMIVFIPCLLDIIDVDAFMNIPGVINSNFEMFGNVVILCLLSGQSLIRMHNFTYNFSNFKAIFR